MAARRALASAKEKPAAAAEAVVEVVTVWASVAEAFATDPLQR
jgi:hypothetical protein